MASLRLVPYGPEAALALRDAIVEAKAGDALAPVTVAVPSNYAGLSLRRRLGSGALLLDGRAGLVNVRFYVLARVAELLGAPVLATKDRRPLTSPVRAEAIRAALAEEPGVFRDVAEHPATERSLDSTFRDLRRTADEALVAVARHGARAADVVRLYRRFRELTVQYYDEEDLAAAAAGAVRSGTAALRDVGHVILYLPRRLSPAEGTLVDALGHARGLTAIIGLTGDEDGDAPARRLAAQLERALGPAAEQPPASSPAGTGIVAVTDAEEEIRAVLRLAMERLAHGTPLHRMALLYPIVQPYALLAHEQFHAAQVPHNGPSVRTLAQTLPGRTLLGLLRLRDEDFRRDLMMDWLSAAPVLDSDGRPAPAQRWDLLSRSAGVVKGAAQWRDRLARHQRSLEQQRRALEETADGDEWKLRRIERDLEHIDRLARFVEELIERLDARRRTTWEQFASWARGLLNDYLGGEGRRRDWPDDEVEAHRAVEEALEALSTLGDLRSRIDEATFRRALERELEGPAERIGRFGEGVFIGRIADAIGADFDVVFLVGMSEGVLPSRARDDPLLPDRERAAAEGLPLRAQRQVEERRDYLAALASAPERVLVYPRGDLRGQRGKLPARWALETASRLEGQRVFSAGLETLARPWFTAIASFEAALAGESEPAAEQEYDLRSLLHWRESGGRALDHYLVRTAADLSAGIAADIERLGSRLTRWDGRVPSDAELAPSADRPVSPTALEHWAKCPFRYFLGRILSVAETAKPEDTLTLTPLERGNLIHHALERFIREARPRSSPDEPWTPAERARLIEIAEELCRDAEASGITGRPLLWRLERERILRDLRGFLDKDEGLRAEYAVVPKDVELSFGLRGDEPPVLVPLAGRTLAFRGRIDRIDRAPDGGRLVVLDYKSGSVWDGHKNLHHDPVHRGQLLQLPVYALAAKAQFGAEAVAAYYWFVTERANYERKGYSVDERELARFGEALEVIVGGIENGLFPARPGQSRQDGFENCRICPYDRVCPRDRLRAWERKRNASDLRPYLDLAEPLDPP